MILKVDHITFGIERVDEGIKAFEALGYKTQFMEKGLTDLENKRAFLHQFSGSVDMALLARSDSVSIELFSHGHIVASPSYVLPVLEGLPFEAESGADSMRFDGSSFIKVKSSLLRAECFVKVGVDAHEFRSNTVILNAANLNKAIEFWSKLGFRLIRLDGSVALLELHSVLSGGALQMYIRGNHYSRKPYLLDSYGFNSLGLISSDAQKEHKRFQQLGMHPTEINSLIVNGKRLSIFWLKGPSGEAAEIIGVDVMAS